MVGGEEEAFEESMPVFEAMGKNIVYQGTAEVGRILRWSIKLLFQQVCWQ